MWPKDWNRKGSNFSVNLIIASLDALSVWKGLKTSSFTKSLEVLYLLFIPTAKCYTGTDWLAIGYNYKHCMFWENWKEQYPICSVQCMHFFFSIYCALIVALNQTLKRNQLGWSINFHLLLTYMYRAIIFYVKWYWDQMLRKYPANSPNHNSTLVT